MFQIISDKFNGVDKVTKTGIQPIFYAVPDDEKTIDEVMKNIGHTDPFKTLLIAIEKIYKECRYFMEDTKFIQTVKSMNFDLMLIDGFPLAPCRYILPYHLGIPYVYQCSVSTDWLLRVPVLQSFHLSYDVLQTIFFSNKMSFGERMLNFMMAVINIFMIPIPFMNDNSLLDEYAQGLSWKDLELKSELFLVTRDYMLEYPTVEFPNIITTPGITL